tara:strand:- start:26880 stop:27539 length:660 start_codon:yes stop_codon:yes gene_type:complete
LNKVRLSKIDPSNWQDHAHIGTGDECYFLREYTKGQGYGFSDTNQLIFNLKKPMEGRGRMGWRYKGEAIGQCASEMKGALNPDWLTSVVLIPVPPSKSRDDPAYDNRMHQVCELIEPGGGTRDLVVQHGSTRASHACEEGERVSVDELKALYRIDEALAGPSPALIGIVDDVVTAGTHFRAMSDVLSARFPDVPITGLFVARRVFPDISFEDFGFQPAK